MKRNVAFPNSVNQWSLLAAAALCAVAAMLLTGLCVTASAKRHPLVSADGQIHACYRVKGKPKGALRVVRGRRAHCQRGERKVAWAVAGASVQPGAAGSQGAPGSTGASGGGEVGTQATVGTTLADQVDGLSARVNSVEGTLGGIGNDDLTGAMATLQGLSNEDLTNAVDALPAVESLCEQNEALTEQVNMLQDVIGGLGLSPALEALGLLEIPTLPTELEPFSCPSL